MRKPIIVPKGQRFGKLVVLGEGPRAANNARTLRLKCDCGKTTVKRLHNLIQGATTSCGCLSNRNEPCHPELLGKKFGRLTLVKWAGMKQYKIQRYSMWECKCDCGKMIVVQEQNIVRHRSSSCGCLIKESIVTHGMSGDPIYQALRRDTHLAKKTGVKLPWKTLGESVLATADAYKAASKHYKTNHLMLDLADPTLPWVPFKNRPKSNIGQIGNLVTIGSKTQNLAGWGRDLGLTRERARQLHVAGLLVERVLNLNPKGNR